MQKNRRCIVESVLANQFPKDECIEFLRQTHETLLSMTAQPNAHESSYHISIDQGNETLNINIKDEIIGLQVSYYKS